MADLATINADIDALDAENDTQAAKIAEAMSLLDGKAAGSGGGETWETIYEGIPESGTAEVIIDLHKQYKEFRVFFFRCEFSAGSGCIDACAGKDVVARLAWPASNTSPPGLYGWGHTGFTRTFNTLTVDGKKRFLTIGGQGVDGGGNYMTSGSLWFYKNSDLTLVTSIKAFAASADATFTGTGKLCIEGVPA